MQYQSLPPGYRPILRQGRDGLMYETGKAVGPDGRTTCNCGTTPGFIPNSPDRFNPRTWALSKLSPVAQSQAMSQGTGINNTFGNLDIPNMGSVGVGRQEGNASPANANLVFSLVLNNLAGATDARQFIGDISGTYVLLGNTEASPAGFVIGGSWGTSSKTQFAQRTAWRPWRVKKIQFIASLATYFDNALAYYFDTQPTPNGPVKDNLTLTNLLSADQYNPTIQWYDRSVRFDGVNGLDITVPAAQKLTINFTIESEASGGTQVLVGRN